MYKANVISINGETQFYEFKHIWGLRAIISLNNDYYKRRINFKLHIDTQEIGDPFTNNEYKFEQDIIYNITIIKYTVDWQSACDVLLAVTLKQLDEIVVLQLQPKSEYKNESIIPNSIK